MMNKVLDMSTQSSDNNKRIAKSDTNKRIASNTNVKNNLNDIKIALGSNESGLSTAI